MTPSLQKTLEQRLATLVALPTVTDDVAVNRAALNAIAKELSSYGMHVHIDGPDHPWLMATTRPTNHPKITLAAHIDVVEPSHPDQLTMRIADGKIYGRGTFDMKFAITAYLEYVRNLAAKDSVKAYDFGILITSDEEKGGYDGAKHWLEKGWRTDLAVIPDGGRDWKLEERAKGIAYLFIEAHGVATHSSRLGEGKNSAHMLIAALQEIIQAYPSHEPDGTTLSVNVLQTNTIGRTNTTQVPDYAKANIDIRSFSARELARAQNFIKKVAATHGLTVTVVLNEPPVVLDKNNELVRNFVASVAEVRKQPVEFAAAYGASDARHLAVYGIPTVLLYPTGGSAHSATEWMAREDLSTFYRVIEAFIARTAYDPAGAPASTLKRLSDLIPRAFRKVS